MHYVWIGAVVAGGAFIQGAIGFAFGIFSVPLLVLIGLPLEHAITMVLTLVCAQSLATSARNPQDIPWRDVVAITLPRWIAVAFGVFLLSRVREHWTPTSIKRLVGGCLLAILVVQWRLRPIPRPRLGWQWTWLAGLSSGVMAGLIGMGGPPIVLWVMAHDWDSRRSRSLMWCTFAFMVPWQLSILFWQFGLPIGRTMLLALCYIPIIYIATLGGVMAGDRLTQTTLRPIAYFILVAVAILSLIQ